MNGAHDAAVLHGDDAFAPAGEFRVMSDKNESCAGPPMQCEDEVDDLGAGLAVEIPGRFVSEQDFGLRRERSGEGDALLLAA